MNRHGSNTPATGGPVVTLYSRSGCHLCEVAKLQLRALQRTFSFTLEEINIESDPELERRFLIEIPVVAVSGEVVTQESIDLAKVREAVIAATLASR